MGSDDGARVYLNGKLVYEDPQVRADDTVAEIGLKRGINTVVFKVANGQGGWLGSVHFTDREGNPVKGIKVGLEPPP